MKRRLNKLEMESIDDLNEEMIEKLVKLNIDPNKILWRRVVDINDRYLRNIQIGKSEKHEFL